MSPGKRFKVYAKLLYLYPSSYRKQYGEQLLQTIADMVDDAPSPSAKAAVWIRISFDLLITAGKEHFEVIGDFMTAKKNYNANRNALISGLLLLLPIVALAINRALMISGPGRGVPTYLLVMAAVIFPVLAITLAGFTLHTLLRSTKGPLSGRLRRVWPLTLVCLASLVFLALIVWDYIRFYTLTH